MTLEEWLRLNNMHATDFGKLVGCSRKTLWKIKNSKLVDAFTSKKVYFVTGGAVKPLVTQKRGRPKKISTTSTN